MKKIKNFLENMKLKKNERTVKDFIEMLKDYPLLQHKETRDYAKTVYEIQDIKSQKFYRRLIIFLQIINITLVALLIYVTWIK